MDYKQLLTAIDAASQALLGRAAKAVNHALVVCNWLIGAHLLEFKQSGQDYRLYPDIRQSLAGELGTIAMRPEIGQSAIGEFDPGPPALPPEHLLRLSWTHFIELIRIDDPLKRAFYEAECLQGNWSIRQLQRHIGSLLYENIPIRVRIRFSCVLVR